MSEPTEPYRPGPSPRGVGHRFRRPLTPEEFAAITAAAQRRGRNGGLDAAFRATWDILLGAAEGLSMAEAADLGFRFHPAEYAIPESQAEALLGIWRRHRGPRYRKDSAAGLLWLDMGPGTYPDQD